LWGDCQTAEPSISISDVEKNLMLFLNKREEYRNSCTDISPQDRRFEKETKNGMRRKRCTICQTNEWENGETERRGLEDDICPWEMETKDENSIRTMGTEKLQILNEVASWKIPVVLIPPANAMKTPQLKTTPWNRSTSNTLNPFPTHPNLSTHCSRFPQSNSTKVSRFLI
jgi:hypothetical protein